MATSLVAELQRLSTPQTSTLVESKSRASILYDAKEAAQVDRQTIFDLGRSGLEDLIVLNPAFGQFKKTLFDETTIRLERSVETFNVNETLNKNIQKFMFTLSPYFMTQSSQHCLEWLIRRYAIHEYNIDEMMALILPYHGTMKFSNCLKIIPLNKKNRWYWMKAIQKPGVAMSKQAIINRAANDVAFLKFISNTTLAAVKELNSRAHTLQAVFAFYSTITLGALDVANKISDSHVSNISTTLSKGLSSNVTDFCAASMIITALLVTKTEIEMKWLKKIIQKLSNISNPELSRESIVLLTIICQTQSESTNMVVEIILLSKMVDNSSTTTTLGSLYKANINVLPLCLPLITKCLEKFDDKKKAKGCQRFVEMLLAELALNNDDANTVIRYVLIRKYSSFFSTNNISRCILSALKPTTKPQSEIIDVDSDDDDDEDDGQWHSNLMATLETSYPVVFDAVKTDILSNQDEESSSLKIVLGKQFSVFTFLTTPRHIQSTPNHVTPLSQ